MYKDKSENNFGWTGVYMPKLIDTTVNTKYLTHYFYTSSAIAIRVNNTFCVYEEILKYDSTNID